MLLFDGADISKPPRTRDGGAGRRTSSGSLDILVNNAGVQFTATIEDFPTSSGTAIIAINLSARFHAMKAAIPGMKKRGWGRIINIASAHGLVGSPQKVAYVAAKHGIMGAHQGRRASSWPTPASPATPSAPAGC